MYKLSIRHFALQHEPTSLNFDFDPVSTQQHENKASLGLRIAFDGSYTHYIQSHG